MHYLSSSRESDMTPSQSLSPSPISPGSNLPCSPLSLPRSHLSLLSLNTDLHDRIIYHLLAPTRRGTPYYPHKSSPDALSLAMTCHAMRSAVARNIVSDCAWLQISIADVHHPAFSAQFKRQLLLWYRVCKSSLTSLTIHARLPHYTPIRERLMQQFVAFPPPLLEIDLTIFDRNPYPQMHETLSQLLCATRSTLKTISLQLTPALIKAVAQSYLHNIETAHIRMSNGTALDLINVLSSFQSMESSKLKHISLRTMSTLPSNLLPAHFYNAAPALTTFEYHEGQVNATASALQVAIAIACIYPKLERLSLHNAIFQPTLHMQLNTIIPHISDLRLLNCDLFNFRPSTGIDTFFQKAANCLTRFHVVENVTSKQLATIALCHRLEHLNIGVDHLTVTGLPHYLPQLKALQALTLNIKGQSIRVERCVVETLIKCSPTLHSFVLHGERLSFSGIRSILSSRGSTLEYLVTGVYTPMKSVSKVIMRLLAVTKVHNPNLKVLCFGLGLTYDRWGVALNQRLLDVIESTEKQLLTLDGSWLRANAAAILKLQRPNGYMDYDSDASDDNE